MSIICLPLIEIGFNDLPKPGGAMAPLAPPGTTPLSGEGGGCLIRGVLGVHSGIWGLRKEDRWKNRQFFTKYHQPQILFRLFSSCLLSSQTYSGISKETLTRFTISLQLIAEESPWWFGVYTSLWTLKCKET